MVLHSKVHEPLPKLDLRRVVPYSLLKPTPKSKPFIILAFLLFLSQLDTLGGTFVGGTVGQRERITFHVDVIQGVSFGYLPNQSVIVFVVFGLVLLRRVR